MPFGLRNAPACFQRITDLLNTRVNPSPMKAYLNDLTAESNSFRDMMGMLEKLFELCTEVKLELHPDKWHMSLKKIRVRGHVLSKEGIHPIEEDSRKSVSQRTRNKFNLSGTRLILPEDQS